MENLTGRQMGQYRVVAPLGEGGMAAVYKAYQPSMDRNVALKILPSHFAQDPNFAYRFEREAKVIANLEHPNILPVYDYGQDGVYTYIVMRFIVGGSLADLLKGSPLPLPQACSIISKIASALDYAHSRGVVHRDVKPSNVLIDEQGNCLLSDFGLAKVILSDSRFTASGAFIGTPAYASPEQCLGRELDHRSDVYSLGVMLYEMVTGRTPFNAETPMAIVVKTIHDPLPPPSTINPSLSADIEQVVLKALAKDPVDRYQSAGDLARAMEAVAGGVSTGPVALPVKAASPGMVSPPGAASKPLASPTSGKRRIPIWGWVAGCAGLFTLLAFAAGAIILIVTFAKPSSKVAQNTSPVRPTKTKTMLVAAAPPATTEILYGLAPPNETSASDTAPTLAAFVDTPTLTQEPTQFVLLSATATATPKPPQATATLVPYTPVPVESWSALADLPRAINAVVWDPANPQVVYAGTGDYAGSGAGVYKSEDAGLSWSSVSTGLPYESVSAMAIARSELPVLYVLVNNVIYASTDGAQTWTKRGSIEGFTGSGPFRLLSSMDGSVLYATGGYGLPVRSNDGAQSWVPFGTGLPDGGAGTMSANVLAMDPSDAKILYAGTGSSGVYKSIDGGSSFTLSNKGMLDYGIMSLAVDPSDTKIVYAGGSSGELFKSTDAGQNWVNLTKSLQVQSNQYPGSIHAIAINPEEAGALYLFADNAGLMVSRDSGGSWQILGGPPGQDQPWFTTVGITFDPQFALIATLQRNGGGWRYAMGVVSTTPTPTLAPVAATAGPLFSPGAWQAVVDLPRAINAFALDPVNSQILYASTGSIGQGGTIYKSADRGLTWQQAANGLPSEGVSAIAASPDGNLVVLSSMNGDAYGSADSAQTWNLLGSMGMWASFKRWLIVAPFRSDIIYSISNPGGLARSQDNGHSWAPVKNGLPQNENETYVLSLAIDPTDANIVYAGTGGFVGQGYGVYKSTDGGGTWLPSNRGMLDYAITALAIDPVDPQIVYAGGDYGELFKSIDGGQTWYNLTVNLTGQTNVPGGQLTGIAIDPLNTARILVVGGLGIMISPDGGITWQPFSVPPDQDHPIFTAWAVRFGAQSVLIVAIENAGAWIYSSK